MTLSCSIVEFVSLLSYRKTRLTIIKPFYLWSCHLLSRFRYSVGKWTCPDVHFNNLNAGDDLLHVLQTRISQQGSVQSNFGEQLSHDALKWYKEEKNDQAYEASHFQVPPYDVYDNNCLNGSYEKVHARGREFINAIRIIGQNVGDLACSSLPNWSSTQLEWFLVDQCRYSHSPSTADPLEHLYHWMI